MIFLPGCICPDRLCNDSDYSSWAAVAGAGGGKLEDAHLTVAIIVTSYHKQYLQNHSLVSILLILNEFTYTSAVLSDAGMSTLSIFWTPPKHFTRRFPPLVSRGGQTAGCWAGLGMATG